MVTENDFQKQLLDLMGEIRDELRITRVELQRLAHLHVDLDLYNLFSLGDESIHESVNALAMGERTLKDARPLAERMNNDYPFGEVECQRNGTIQVMSKTPYRDRGRVNQGASSPQFSGAASPPPLPFSLGE